MKSNLFVSGILCGLAGLCWWLMSEHNVAVPSEGAVKSECDPDHIGALQMEMDGTLKAFLIACEPGHAIGHAMMVYRPNDLGYAPMLDRVGGLSPGESKPIPAYKGETK